MVDNLESPLPLTQVFNKIDEVNHNLEMFTLGEDVDVDSTELLPLFQKAGELVIKKINYGKTNLVKFPKFRDRLFVTGLHL